MTDKTSMSLSLFLGNRAFFSTTMKYVSSAKYKVIQLISWDLLVPTILTMLLILCSV